MFPVMCSFASNPSVRISVSTLPHLGVSLRGNVEKNLTKRTKNRPLTVITKPQRTFTWWETQNKAANIPPTKIQPRITTELPPLTETILY